MYGIHIYIYTYMCLFLIVNVDIYLHLFVFDGKCRYKYASPRDGYRNGNSRTSSEPTTVSKPPHELLFWLPKIRNEFLVWNISLPPGSDDIFSLGHTISLIAEDQFTTSMWTMDLTSLTGVFLSEGLVAGCWWYLSWRSNPGNPRGPPSATDGK